LRKRQTIGTLISSKVNQWTLLVGSLPVAYLAGGGTGLVLDGRQVEEFPLTAAQTLLGIAAFLALRFPRWLAFTLLGLFAVQYALPGQAARYVLCTVYGGIAVAALARNRRHILPTLTAPFRRDSRRRKEHADANAAAGPHPAHLRLRSATVGGDAPAAPRHALRAGPAAGAPQLETVAPRPVRDYQKISTERVPGPPWSCPLPEVASAGSGARAVEQDAV